MFLVQFTNPCKKDFKKLPAGHQGLIEEIHLPQIQNDPYEAGERLKGIFRMYWKYKFVFKSVDYRIIYQIQKNQLIIVLVLIGTRENLYKKLRRRV